MDGLYGICSPNWCISGDFNVIRFPFKKSNRGRETNSMKMFNEFIRKAELTDPELINTSLTWSNLKEEVVCCRLDKFLFSSGCEGLFPSFMQEALVRATSDHWPILMYSNFIK